jgi:hypothetical protein
MATKTPEGGGHKVGDKITAKLHDGRKVDATVRIPCTRYYSPDALSARIRAIVSSALQCGHLVLLW